MRSRRYLGALLALVLVGALATTAAATPPIAHDDFQAGIDAGRWTLHPAGGITWIPATENANGYATSPAQVTLDSGDRQDNLLTVRTDFTDFDMTWQWRFRSDSWHAARRDMYFRCDDTHEPIGYWLHVAVNDPPQPHPMAIWIAGLYAGQFTWNSMVVDYPWLMNTWYSFRLRAVGNTFKVKWWLLGQPEPAAWMLEDADPTSAAMQGRVGFGDYWWGQTDVDNVVLSSASATPPAFPVRNPQVPVNGSELQNYLNGLGESINAFTDQLAAQTYIPSVSGNSAMTLMIELAGFAAQNKLGVYDANLVNPVRYEVFPAEATERWSALVSFQMNGDLVVNVFDEAGVLRSHTPHPGANIGRVAFWLEGPGGTFYSEDYRNGDDTQAVMYAGTGRNGGDFWVCWEDLHVGAGADLDYDDAVILIQSLQPVPASNATWGRIKAQYR